MKWIKNAWNWITGKIKAVFTLAIENASKDAIEMINNAELQQQALQYVTELATSALTNSEKRETAVASLIADLKAKGKELKEGVARILVEAVYMSFKGQATAK